jgi:phage-related baseplate assembly protein
VTYASEPYVQFVDDVLTALTGGVIRDEFRFLPENVPFRLHSAAPPIPSTVRVFGVAAGDYRRFQAGKDYQLTPDFTINWLTSADAVPPDAGTVFFANYEVTIANGVNPTLTDRNPGSVTRLLAESFGREFAVFSSQLEGIYNASFVETASGGDLDQIGLLVGVHRRTATFAIGAVIFFRSTPSPAEIFVPAGTRISTSKPPPAQFETQIDAVLRQGALSVEVPIQAVSGGAAGVVSAQSITVINNPIFGIDGVNNAQPTGFQSAGETDAELRTRIQRSLEGAGRATTGALVSALTTIPGLRDKDVQVLEDPISKPGLIQVNVALPQLPAGREAQLLADLSERAVALIEDVRPVGVRIVHNIDAPKPTGPGEAGPGIQPPEGDAPVTTAIPPQGSLSLPVDVNAFLTPTTRNLTVAQQAALIAAGANAVRAFIADAGIGETLVYNRLVSRLMELDGILDVAVEMFPQTNPGQARRKNILPIDPALRPVPGKVDVRLGGTLILIDIQLSVVRKGAGLLTDLAQLGSTIATDATTLLNARLRSPGLSQLTSNGLIGLLGTSDTYDVKTLDYFVEYQDAGVRIHSKDPQITASPSDQFWVRSMNVEVH